ncbi:ogr/Delta-like zinc finger family protein [bacterium]|nr:ogr/Delta-like zinc finger family protein [bacterium]
MAEPSIPLDPREMHDAPPVCTHCGEPMLKMLVPPMAAFDSPWIYVCFNEECGYYVRGWERMESQYASKSSYRYKHDPFTGETGPFPVWSPDAMRDRIVEDKS